MTHEELISAINGLANGENAETIASIGSEIDALYTTIDAANAAHEADTKKISDLNDTNMKLFLRVTGKPPEEQDPPEKEQTLDEFIKELATPKKED